jgi:DNA-dependent protein kinase catalytic subunit
LGKIGAKGSQGSRRGRYEKRYPLLDNSLEQENPTSWFPKKKIDVVKRKLQKTNPSYITFSELQEKSVHSNAPYLKHLQQIVLGEHSVNIRARVKEKCSSTMEQVECLIDQATDPNILGRTYNGWAPWV